VRGCQVRYSENFFFRRSLCIFMVQKPCQKYTMQFEFDPEKSRLNKEKHGIDFIEAQVLWDDDDLVEIPARTTGESRFIVIGLISGRCWSGVITYRGETIRIISVRRSRPEEVMIHENRGI
jgi:uncharacterized DUF497 family protein